MAALGWLLNLGFAGSGQPSPESIEFDLHIDQQRDFDLHIDQQRNFNLYIDQQVDFDLER